MRTISPQSVSAALRRGGLLPVPRHSRDGVSVSKMHTATLVSVQASIAGRGLDDPQAHRDELALMDEAQRVLAAAGYTVARKGNHLHVTKQD